ncbi:MAG: pantetheine-phosphate adenylyltransferase [Candidatus Dormibacteria bacterium]
MTTRTALYPGSFDPVTLGHLDILDRAGDIFDRVIVAVLENPTKTPLFSVDERVELLRRSIGESRGSEVATYSGLTVDCARRVGAVAIVRGLRVVSDFETEFQMALMNRRQAPDINTVFLMTSFSHIFISSTLIKEVCRLGGSIDDLVPPATREILLERFQVGSAV